MAKVFPSLLPEHIEFMGKQRMFFVASAPVSAERHVNLSPKGYDVFRVLSSCEVAYLDLTGSGNETSAHLKENGRITLMFMALEGPPMILRLYGEGRVVMPETYEWKQHARHFPILPGTRQIICAKINLVKTSCGFGVPFYSYSGDRDTLQQWASKKGEQGLAEYREDKNAVSMDGMTTPLGEGSSLA